MKQEFKNLLKKSRFAWKVKAALDAFEKADKPLPVQPVTQKSPEDVHPVYLVDGVTEPQTVADLKLQYCTGCSACYNVCPVKAITMQPDAEGYWSPCIDEAKCIHCGLCAKKCPVIHTPKENLAEPPCHAVMVDDETRRNSSSGGMFSALAQYVFDRGGYVAGVALNDRFEVEHILIDSPDEMYKLRGSKYVQSRVGDIYQKVQALLKENKLVLFTGTPCQVAGLNNFLGKKYDNLLTADLICHGSPSQKVFSKYLQDYYGIENLEGFKFRTKELGYNSFNSIAYLKNGEKVVGNIKFDAYEKVMHSGLSLKTVCTDCMFAPTPRQGDFTIGDFWGISKFDPKYNDNIGTSCVLLNTEKAQAIFAEIQPSLKTDVEVPLDIARRNNRFGQKMRTPAGRSHFYELIEKQPIDKAVDYALNNKYDVAVVGLWYGRNYGSMATYYALNTVLNQMGLSVLMVENSLRPDSEVVDTKTHPRKIADRYYNVSAKYRLDELKKLNAQADTFILGSDQLWNVYLSRPYRQTYFLDFVSPLNKKIAYATSLGPEYRGTEEERLISRHYLKQFDHISVRDEMAKEACEKLFDVQATEVCDPAFLPPMEAYEELISHAHLEEKEPYILAYILDPTPEMGALLAKIAKEKNRKVVVILNELPHLFDANVEKLSLPENSRVEIKREVDLHEWMWYYKNATAVVTDSFHGTIYSIIFKQPFITLSNARRGAARFISLLSPLDLESRLFQSVEELDRNMDLIDAMDYTQVYEKLEAIKAFSMDWLKNAIYSDKKVKNFAVYSYTNEKKEESEE